jgi:tRNA-specific 2-thiouridylase
MLMKIAVAMSGGVDSSVAALLLKQKYENVIGVTFKVCDEDGFLKACSSPCLTSEDTRLASDVALKLGIEHRVFNYGENFERDVVERFVATYKSGGTPNPCVECNKYVKFGALLKESIALGCTHIATGHYAKVEYDAGSGRYLLKKAADGRKDQTYMLYSLDQEKLSRTVLPLGGYTKAEIRELAALNGFSNADRRDSQDICFVPDGDYTGFIERYTGERDLPGDFVDADGNFIAKHKGITHYTVGQGKHLGISIGRKAFVSDIDPISRKITIGDDSLLYKKSLVADEVNIIPCERLETRTRVTAKIRYSAKEAPAWAWQDDEGKLYIEFDEPQRAITRGQSVVMYDGDTVIGGGKII